MDGLKDANESLSELEGVDGYGSAPKIDGGGVDSLVFLDSAQPLKGLNMVV